VHCEHAMTGGQSTHSATAHEHCAPRNHAPAPQHHGCCTDCCLTAVVGPALDWLAAAADAPELCLSPPRAPLTVSLDRLDRPPRYIT
jgi:hypothetical protein